MRKCPACGYLVFGDSERCKHCGAELPVLVGAALAPGAPAAATPGPLPVALVAPPVPPVPPVLPRASYDPAPAAAPVAAPGREYWTPEPVVPRAAPTRSRSTPRVVLALICVVSMAFGYFAFTRVFESDPLPPGTSAFVHGQGVTYSSPDRTFNARFPFAPAAMQRRISVASASASLDIAQVQTDDYELVAASIVLPAAVPPARVDAVLHDIVLFGAIQQGDKVVSEQQITKYGVPGLEVNVSVDDGYDARMMVLASGTHFYLLGVHSKHATKRLFDALATSLIMY
jgi:hypothetical protein